MSEHLLEGAPDPVGHSLRQLRKERRLPLAEVAARAGLSTAELARLERGEHRIGLDALVRLLAVLGPGGAPAGSRPTPAAGRGSSPGAGPEEGDPPPPRRTSPRLPREPLVLL